MSDDIAVESSGNVFTDLGFDNPEEELLKAKLVRAIRAIMERRKLGEHAAAELLGMNPAEFAGLARGDTGTISTGRLVSLIERLDYDVDVVVRRKDATGQAEAIA